MTPLSLALLLAGTSATFVAGANGHSIDVPQRAPARPPDFRAGEHDCGDRNRSKCKEDKDKKPKEGTKDRDAKDGDKDRGDKDRGDKDRGDKDRGKT